MEWISVGERAPEVDENVSSEDVLVCGTQIKAIGLEGVRLTTIGWLEKNGWHFVGENQGIGNRLEPVTHWMPLPEPPSVTGYTESER
ncbi:hypothetical protein LCGC14_1864730 [marine sediment metagenome]|uniref:DUF551 domain-containing protein n=1 Tax=marine sediment metagenome TaxID=412755 RepID=A0A0F9IKY5_9ZZZZ